MTHNSRPLARKQLHFPDGKYIKKYIHFQKYIYNSRWQIYERAIYPAGDILMMCCGLVMQAGRAFILLSNPADTKKLLGLIDVD